MSGHHSNNKLQTIAPMEIFGLALNDMLNSGEDKHIEVYSLAHELLGDLPASNGFNPLGTRDHALNLAIDHCQGLVLDIGACAGKVSVALQSRGLTVHALDVAQSCVDYLNNIGLKHTICCDIQQYNAQQYDTILCLGSTLGVCQQADKLSALLQHMASLLKPNGQLLIEDTAFDDDEDYEAWQAYFRYKEYQSTTFDWINFAEHYVAQQALATGLRCEPLISSVDNLTYLLKITKP